jgi:hypothetical protein
MVGSICAKDIVQIDMQCIAHAHISFFMIMVREMFSLLRKSCTWPGRISNWRFSCFVFECRTSIDFCRQLHHQQRTRPCYLLRGRSSCSAKDRLSSCGNATTAGQIKRRSKRRGHFHPVIVQLEKWTAWSSPSVAIRTDQSD